MKATHQTGPNAARRQCADCGASVSRAATRCMSCEYARRGPKKTRPCADCGKRTRGKLCHDCWRSEENFSLRQIPKPKLPEFCELDGCDGKRVSRGLCEKHYARLKRHDDPHVVRPHPRKGQFPKCTECGTRIKNYSNRFCVPCWKKSVRNDAPCAVEGCKEPHASRGYCCKHAHRVARYGDPHIARLRSIELVKLLPEPTGECIEWQGYITSNGYGRAVHNGRAMGAHRFVWELQVGPIPPGLELDHLCCNRSCVNVKHLEPVTGTENKRRRWIRWWARQKEGV